MWEKCPMGHIYTAVFVRNGDWWAAYVEDLPGANDQGATPEDARENVRGAGRLVLEANQEIARRRESGRSVARGISNVPIAIQ
jgi:predicted RNase H-like HicB family nuclease